MNIPIGQSSNIDYVFIQDSSSTTGAGLTGITSGSSGLAGRYIYPGGTSVALTFETITTLGTYQAPTSNAHLRIKELDATNHPGVYEIHYHNDWFSTANARKAAILTIKGVTNMAQLNHKVTIDYSLQPTTAARTLDVASTGEAGLDYNNVNGTVGDSAGTTTLLARIGALTGTGVNTVLGIFKALLSKTATTPSDIGGTFDPSTDSTEAIRDRGDAAWTTITAAAIRSALGMAAANLDSTLDLIESETSDIQTKVNNVTYGLSAIKTLIDTLTAYVDTEVAAIKTKTDNLPTDPADESSIQAAIANLLTYVDTEVAAILAAVDTEIGAIKAKTDNLPTDPADESLLEAAIADLKTYVDTEILAIKAKTDLIPASPAAIGSPMTLDQTQALDETPVVGSLGEALVAARAQGFGKWTVVGTTLSLYASDGTTVVKAFTLDDADAPTSRTPA